jgi:hypothetical protein
MKPGERSGDSLVRGLATLLRGEPTSWTGLATSADAFVAACAEQDLTPLIYRTLATDGSGWPGDVIGRIAGQARTQVGVEMARTRETRQALDALAAAGVPALIFKGTALAHAIYPHPSLRPRNDTDLLVRPADRDAARTALEGAGYTATTYCDGEVLFRQYELQREDALGITHALDVHWGLSTQALFADLFDFDELEAGSVAIPALGNHARAFGPVHALLCACVHPTMHHHNEERLIWAYDVHLLGARLSPSDWRHFADTASAKSVAAICRNALQRAVDRLGTRVPRDVLARLDAAAARGEPSARYLEAGRRWGDELASSLRALRWRDRLRLVREVAFPAPRYMLAAYGVSGARFGAALLPALYAHRGVRGLWKVLTGRK